MKFQADGQGFAGQMFELGSDPREIVKQEGLGQVSGGRIKQVVRKILSDNPNAVEDYKKAKPMLCSL